MEIASKEIKDKFIQINAISPGIKIKNDFKTLKNRKLVAKEEIQKIKQQVSSSYKTLDKIYKVIQFFNYKKKLKNIRKID